MFKGIAFLCKFCWKYNKKFIIFNIIAGIVNIIYPLISIIIPKYIINELIGEQRINMLIILTSILCLGNFIGNYLSKLISGYLLNQKNELFNEFQMYLCDNLINADFEQLESADFLWKKDKAYKYIYGDGNGFASIFVDFTNIISQSLTIIALAIIIINLSPLILLVLISAISLSAFIDFKFQNIQFNLNMEKVEVERQNKYYMKIIEDFTVNKDIKIYNMKDWIKLKYSDTLYKLNIFYRKLTKAFIRNAFVKTLITLIEQSALYFYLIIEILKNSITIGDFSMYISAFSKISSSIKAVIEAYIRIVKSEKYYKELDDFMNLPSIMRNENGIKINEDINTIEFKNVSFKYPNQNFYILNNISLLIKSNEKISIVGENGAGKTTFIKLLIRLYDPTEGTIYLNGKDIKLISHEEYMKLFSVVFQDYKLFAFSILENIVVGNSKIDNKEIIESLKNSGIYEKVCKLEKGIETNIYKIFDNKGIEFSGGESQKLALARALYKNAPIMILDEPTSALDPRAEYQLYSNFNKCINNKIAIYISHRLSSSKFCDKVLVFKDGTIVEQGSHEQLIKKCGLYSELFNMQANQYLDIAQ